MIEIYHARFKVVMALQLQYRAAVIIWMIGSMFEPVIYLVVWTAVAQSNGGATGGYTQGEFAAYFIVLLIVNHFTQIWHIWEFDSVIREGILSTRLLQPLHPIHYDLARNIAYKAVGLLGLVPAVIILIFTFQPTLTLALGTMLAFVPALLMAAALNFMGGWIIGCAAFWTTRSYALSHIYFLIMFFFSGQIAPLSFLPSVIQTAADWLPYRWMIAFPIEVLLGRVSSEQWVHGLGMQFIWLIVMSIIYGRMWQRGLRHYSAVGG